MVRNLSQNIENNITSMNIDEEKTKLTTLPINVFISFRLIHKELKNITSSTL
jgi:hypothetical protein